MEQKCLYLHSQSLRKDQLYVFVYAGYTASTCRLKTAPVG